MADQRRQQLYITTRIQPDPVDPRYQPTSSAAPLDYAPSAPSAPSYYAGYEDLQAEQQPSAPPPMSDFDEMVQGMGSSSLDESKVMGVREYKELGWDPHANEYITGPAAMPKATIKKNKSKNRRDADAARQRALLLQLKAQEYY